MSIDFKPSDAKAIRKEAHQVYLDNWETKTQFAENGANAWTPDMQHRNHQAMEDLSSAVDLLASIVEDCMKRIDELEAKNK